MAKKPEKAAPRLTDAERHKRFVDMAKEVEASDNPEDFDQAFDKVATPSGRHPRRSEPPASS